MNILNGAVVEITGKDIETVLDEELITPLELYHMEFSDSEAAPEGGLIRASRKSAYEIGAFLKSQAWPLACIPKQRLLLNSPLPCWTEKD